MHKRSTCAVSGSTSLALETRKLTPQFWGVGGGKSGGWGLTAHEELRPCVRWIEPVSEVSQGSFLGDR